MRYYLFLLLALAACQPRNFKGGQETVLSDTARNASCAYMTVTPQGQPVVSWVEDGSMYFAVSPDGGQTFSAPRQVTTAEGIQPHAENMPKIIFRPNGEAIAMYGVESDDPRNKYAGKVRYARSADGGLHWEPSRPLVTDTAGYDQRYFDMALLPSGEVAAIWLDNRKFHQQEGSTLYMAIAADTAGFRQERALVQTVCQCCRTALYTDAQGALHAAFRDIMNDSIRDMVHMVSTDGGQTFSPPVRISADNWVINGCPHTGPAMVKNGSGVHFAWFTMGSGQGVFYCQSPDNGITYSKKESISALPTAKHPQLAALGSGELALVWDEAADTAASRIGIVHKATDGKTLAQGFLTEPGGYASFPVLKAVGENQVLVAYKRRQGPREVVCVRMVSL
ncbi:sialidase family protein [Chitinophaga alhagiae]|uniref:sialidase family protein n=1 Tax=Chitinophaga alhagiae TaxID=2203219 RepID=UPI000E5B9EF5|nr:sialidase family protein [Chitinophaga alhagiae]